jgi:hypothetical protein
MAGSIESIRNQIAPVLSANARAMDDLPVVGSPEKTINVAMFAQSLHQLRSG